MTNREWINLLSDEGLARLLLKSDICDFCIHKSCLDVPGLQEDICIDGIVRWLKRRHTLKDEERLND